MKTGDIIKYKNEDWMIFAIDSPNRLVHLSIVQVSGVYSINRIESVKFSDFLLSFTEENCNHTFMRYEGFTQCYNYCTLCDQKEYS